MKGDSRNPVPVTRLCGMLALCGLSGAVSAEEPVLLNDRSGGQIVIQAETELSIEGFSGTVAVRAGKSGELRYEIRALADRNQPRALALWSTKGVLRLVPIEPPATEPLLVEIAVPPALAVNVDLSDSKVEVSGLNSPVGVTGARLELDIRGIAGTVDLAVSEATVRIDGIAGDVSFEGESVRLDLRRVQGSAGLTVQGGEVTLAEVSGETDADLGETVFNAVALVHGARVQAAGGRISLGQVSQQVELVVEGTPVEISGASGRVTVDSDSEVTLNEVQGTVILTGYGGVIRGTASSGPLEITIDDADVTLEQWQGKIDVRGDGLDLAMRQITGSIAAATTSSNFVIERVEGPVTIENEFGDVRVSGVSGTTKIVNRDGITVAADLNGQLDLHGSGERVEVSWAQLGSDANHVIENAAGQVVLRVPTNARCRFDVRSEFGEVNSQLPGVQVSDDGTFASGALGGAEQPTIQVRSSGDVELSQYSPPAPTQ
ncbi:MAG TPA: hypothetical protein VD788_07400 [Candidatus Polarisedimenticolaceae bacterium]|nr:hypothetical protein [Candidatus Polarisedimenticolaceae bacterium]